MGDEMYVPTGIIPETNNETVQKFLEAVDGTQMSDEMRECCVVAVCELEKAVKEISKQMNSSKISIEGLVRARNSLLAVRKCTFSLRVKLIKIIAKERAWRKT